ncbi:MAG: hypothetical protein WC728_09130 [Elusimicrobiota bacterium]
MEDSKPDYPANLANLEAIENLDTARMALRWALERIHALESQRTEAESKAKQETRLREAVERRIESSEREWAAKAAEAERRGHFQGKIAQMRLEQKEAALDEERKQLEDHSRSCLASLQEEADRLRALLREQSQEHLAALEKLVSERLESQRLAWERGKALLTAERDRLALRVQELEEAAATPAHDALRACEGSRRLAEEARAQADEARAQQTALESQLARLRTEHDRAKALWEAERAKVLSEMEAWSRKALERPRELDDASAKLGAALERSQALSERVKSLESELQRERGTATADAERQRLTLRAVEEEARAEAERRKALGAELDRLKERLPEWKSEHEELERLKAWRSEVEKRLPAWKSERERLRAELERFKAWRAEATTRLLAWKAEREKMLKTIRRLRQLLQEQEEG